MDALIFLKCNLLLLAGMVVYRLIIRAGATLLIRRWFLLLLPVFAWSIACIKPGDNPAGSLLPVYPVNAALNQSFSEASTDHQLPWVLIGYFAIMLSMLLIVVLRMLIHQRQMRNVHPRTYNNLKVYVAEHIHTPYSFFRNIYLPAEMDPVLQDHVLKHEQAHARQLHSFDVLYFWSIRAMMWINPAAWLLFREARLVHECLADAAAARENKAEYASALVASQFGMHTISFHHTFYQPSILKQRLMQLSTPAPKQLILRLAISCMCLCAIGLFTVSAQSTPKSSEVSGDEVYPVFPGGNEGMIQFLTSELKYPETAKKNNVQGTVYVSFVVKENGKVTNAKIVKSVDPELDAEALRVINAMPDWTPGTKNGKATNFDMQLPLRFALQ